MFRPIEILNRVDRHLFIHIYNYWCYRWLSKILTPKTEFYFILEFWTYITKYKYFWPDQLWKSRNHQNISLMIRYLMMADYIILNIIHRSNLSVIWYFQALALMSVFFAPVDICGRYVIMLVTMPTGLFSNQSLLCIEL